MKSGEHKHQQRISHYVFNMHTLIALTVTKFYLLMLYCIQHSCHYLLSLVTMTQHILSYVVSWAGGRYTGERFAVSPVQMGFIRPVILITVTVPGIISCQSDLKVLWWSSLFLGLLLFSISKWFYPRAQFHHSVRRTLTVSDFLCHLVVSQFLLTLLLSKPLYEIQVHLNPLLYYCLEKQHGWSQSATSSTVGFFHLAAVEVNRADRLLSLVDCWVQRAKKLTLLCWLRVRRDESPVIVAACGGLWKISWALESVRAIKTG